MTSLSIITVTFNAGEALRDCIESVAKQSAPVEHILIDGASRDDTVAIAESYAGHFARIVSEPDQGIYDAMNKGLGLATGDVVGILNADDFYAGDDTLARVLAVFDDPTVEACYGDLLYVDPIDHDKVVRYWRSGTFKAGKFYWGWMPPHPTFFVRREVYEKYGRFNLEQGSSADYEIMLRFLLRNAVKAVYIPEVLVKMRTGGVSNATVGNRLRANRMDRKAWTINGLKPYPFTLAMKPLRKIGQWFLKP